MWNFKSSSLLNVFAVLTAILIATGCWKPEKSKKISTYNATYYVAVAEGNRVGTDMVNPTWLVPEVVHYRFKACLNDLEQNADVKKTEFEIHADQHVFKDETDDSGCLEWSEPMAYNYFAEPKTVIIERTLRPLSNGSQRGEVTLRFGVTPWYGDRPSVGVNEEVLFIKDEDVIKTIPQQMLVQGKDNVRMALAGIGTEAPELRMNNVITHVTKVADHLTEPTRQMRGVVDVSEETHPDLVGPELEMNIQMNPVVMLKSRDGVPVPDPVKGGAFRVFAQIIATDLGESSTEAMILTPDMPSQVGVVDKGDKTLQVSMSTVMSRKVSKGRLMLALKVVPLNNYHFRPFECLYLMGEFNELRGKKNPTRRPEKCYSGQFNYTEYLKSIAGNYESLLRREEAQRNEGFDYSIMKINWERVQPGETSTTRTVNFRASTCITDSDTGEPIKNQKFLIKQGDTPAKPESTDHEGCLYWVGQVTHKYYQPEDLFFVDVDVTHLSSGRNKILRMAINPWDDKFTFGRDLRNLTRDYIESIQKRGKKASTFFLAGFVYQTLRFRYEIDEFMNLRVKKTVLMLLDPRVLRYNSIVLGRNATEKLRDGIYLMKVALQKDYLDPAAKGIEITRDVLEDEDEDGKRVMRPAHTIVNPETGKRLEPEEIQQLRKRTFITVVQKLVRVEDGRIITPIEFTMRDLRLMRIRSNFFVQLETIDESRLTLLNLIDEKLKKQLNKTLEDIDKQRRETNQMLTEAERKEYYRRHTQRLYDIVREIRDVFHRRRRSPLESQLQLDALYKQYGIDDEDLKVLEQNDFTLRPAIAGVDYNELIDHDSGLERRTFYGPLTLINNTNSSSMRPTNLIDEKYCETEDCNQLWELAQGRKTVDNSAYERDRYYGSTEHFENIHVDNFIKEAKFLETLYYLNGYLSSHLHNYIRAFNLKFISLRDEVLRKIKPRCENIEVDPSKLRASDEELYGTLDKCLEPTDENTIKADNFVDLLNKANRNGAVRRLNKEDVVKLVKDRTVDQAMGAALCKVFYRDIYNVLEGDVESGNPNLIGSRTPPGYATFHQCLRAVAREEQEDVFIVDQKIRIKQTGRYRFLGGKSLNVNVGSTFGVATSESSSWHIAYDFMGLPGLLKPFSMLPLPKVSFNRDGRKTRSDATFITNQTFLVMQTASFDIELLKYERCAVIRLNPEFINQSGLSSRLFSSYDPDNEENIYRFRGMYQTGLFICTGQDESEPLAVRERYYYFTQFFTEGDMLDQGDLYNHPWLLQLRGVRDARTFLGLIREQDTDLWPNRWPLLGTNRLVKNENWAFQQLVNAYTKILPTFPGLYTIIPEEEWKVDFPFSTNPSASFRWDTARGVAPYMLSNGIVNSGSPMLNLGEKIDPRVGTGIPDDIVKELEMIDPSISPKNK